MIPNQYGTWTRITKNDGACNKTTWKKGFKFKGAFDKNTSKWILYKNGHHVADISKEHIKYIASNITDTISDLAYVMSRVPVVICTMFLNSFKKDGYPARYRTTDKKGKVSKWKNTTVQFNVSNPNQSKSNIKVETITLETIVWRKLKAQFRARFK